jgi:hypothetical protein
MALILVAFFNSKLETYYISPFLFVMFYFAETTCNSWHGDKPGKPCIFPFYLEGQLYTECKWDSDGTEWCPTEVDSYARGVKWGMCGPGCPKLDSKTLFAFFDSKSL